MLVLTENFITLSSLRGRRKKVRGGGRRKVRKRGKGSLTFSPQSPFFSPFLPIPYPFQRLLRRLSTVRVELLKVINLGDVTMTTGALFAVNLGLPKHFLEFLLEHSIITLKAKRIH